MRALRLFYRPGCHLCEDMQEQLESYRERGGFTLERFDISRDAELERVYGTRIPVLETAEGRCLSEYFLDERSLLSYLEEG